MAGSSLSSNNAYFLMSGRYNQPDAYGFDTWIQNGQIGAEIPEVGPGWLGGQWYFPVSLTADTWTMITQTITTGTYDLYIDGVLVGTKSLGAATPQMMHSPANFGVGRDSFVGLMDEFNLFSSALTPAQVWQLYNTQVVNVAGPLPVSTNMVVNGGATFDLGGINQTIASLSDGAGGGGTVASNVASGYGSVTLTLAPAGGSATFSGVIQNGARDQMNLTLSGSGTQVLAGSNTYSGLTTIAAGTLQIGSGGTTGSINNTSAVVDNSLLAFNRSDAVTLAAAISGSGGLTQMAPRHADPHRQRDLHRRARRLQHAAPFGLRLPGASTFASPIGGGGAVQQMGGMLTLAAQNTYNGPTIISGGTLQVDGINATLPGLVMRVPMAGPVGNTLTRGQTLPDISGNGYNMQFDDEWGGSATFVAGRVGAGIQFGTGGGGQMLQIGTLDGGLGGGRSPTMIPTLNTWTASIWVDIPSSTMGLGGSVPLWSGARNDNGDTLWYNNSGSFQLLVINAADNNWIVNTAIPGTMSPDTWHMVTETVGAGQEKLYLDGTLLGTETFSDTPQFTQPNSCFEFGYNGWIGWGPGPFSLQDFQLYGTALSATQVATLYAPVGTLPSMTGVQIGGGVLDLNGASQSVASLSNYNGVGGTVTNTSSTSATLTLTPTAGTNRFSGVIGNGLRRPDLAGHQRRRHRATRRHEHLHRSDYRAERHALRHRHPKQLGRDCGRRGVGPGR